MKAISAASAALQSNRGRRVVLRVGVVVAALAEAELRAHRQHRRSARGEQQRQEIALIARPRGDDRGILGRPLDAVIPGVIGVGSVAVALAVRLVVLPRVGDEVGEGEAVVRDDVVDALRRRRGAPEHVARARHAGRDLAAHAGIAAPEAARGVAKAVVPFGQAGAERAEPVAAGTDVPGLGDEPRLAQERVFGERLEEQRVGIEAVRPAAEGGGEIEAEAVDAAMDHPSPQRADRHVDDERLVEREAIAGAGVVYVARRIPGVEAEPGRVVEAAEGQGGTELVTLAVVVEDDVEDRLHARGVQRVGRRAHLRPAAGRKARIGRAEHDRIVAPGVREAEGRQVPLVDEGVGRHDLDRGDPERGQMRDRGGMGQSGEGSARAFGDRGIEAREAAQVELVDDERFGSDPLAAGLARRRRAGDGLRRMGAAVLAEGEHRGMQTERAVEAPCIGVGEQLGGVEAPPARRIVSTLDAKAVARARAKSGREAAKDAARVAGHRGAENLAFAVVKTERGALGVRQDERRLEPVRRDRDAKDRLRSAHSADRAMER